MNKALQNFLNLIKPDKVYVLQHAHCGHIALKSARRRSLEAVHATAFSRGMHAWRVRLEPANPPQGTCDVCKRQVKALGIAPRRAKRTRVTA